MNNLKRIITVIFFFLITCQAFAQAEGYIIRKGDVLDVVVMQHQEFSISGITVLPDGTIQYPGFGNIVVAGMDTQQLSDSLQVALDKYLVNPMVTVFVRKISDQMLNVFGYVNRPGQYQVYEAIDLFSALAYAGGIKDYKKVRYIYILRENMEIEEFRIKNFFLQDEASVKIPFVYAGDTIYVREPRIFNWSMLSFFASLLSAIAVLVRTFV